MKHSIQSFTNKSRLSKQRAQKIRKPSAMPWKKQEYVYCILVKFWWNRFRIYQINITASFKFTGQHDLLN